MNTAARFSSALLIGLLLCSICAAEVRIELPLGTHYRVGRYLPLRIVVVVEQSAELRIEADGAVATVLPLRPGRNEVVVPLLPLRSPLGELRLQIGGDEITVAAPDRAMRPNEALVGHVVDDVTAATALFSERSVISIRLNPTNPLTDASAAWEALDALLLDEMSYRRLRDEDVSLLIAAGTVLVVAAPDPPDERWPWQRLDESHWVLRLDPAGPGGAARDGRHYEAAQAWRAEWPASFRRQVLLLGVLAACGVGAAALWRSRLAPAAVLIVAVLCVAGFTGWRAWQMPVPHVRGDVLIEHPHLVQRDQWHFQAAIHDSAGAFRWAGLTYPMLVGPAHMERTNLALHCRHDGQPVAFAYDLPRAARVAFLTRSIEQALPVEPPRRPITSPLQITVRQSYLAAGDELRGEIGEGNPWPTIVVRRGSDEHTDD